MGEIHSYNKSLEKEILPSLNLKETPSQIKEITSGLLYDLKEKTQDNLLKSSVDISEKLNSFSLEYVEAKFLSLFFINIYDLDENFTEINGQYNIIFKNLKRNLTPEESTIFNNLRTLYVLLKHKEEIKGKETIGITLSGSGGNMPIHLANLQQMEEENSINGKNISIIGSSGGALIGVMYSLAKTYQPNLSSKEIFDKYYPKDLEGEVGKDGVKNLLKFKESFANITGNKDFSKLKFLDLKIPLMVNFRSEKGENILAGGDMLIEPYLMASIDVIEDININTPTGKIKDLGIYGDSNNINNNGIPYKVLQKIGIENKNILISNALELLYNPNIGNDIGGYYSDGTINGSQTFSNSQSKFDNAYSKLKIKKEEDKKNIIAEEQVNIIINNGLLINVDKEEFQNYLKNDFIWGGNNFLKKYSSYSTEDLLSIIEPHYKINTKKGVIYLYSFKGSSDLYLYSSLEDIVIKSKLEDNNNPEKALHNLLKRYISGIM